MSFDEAGVLLAADDTAPSLRGVRRFIEESGRRGDPVSVDLLNVRTPVHRDVSTFVEEAAAQEPASRRRPESAGTRARAWRKPAFRQRCTSASATSSTS